MADSTTQLDRIADLVDQLKAIGNKQRGMRIESGEWNTLVDVATGILQIERLQEQRTGNLLDQRYAPKDHEHLGEVSIAWLDADLQSRVGGANGSVSTRQSLADMDQKIQSLSADVGRLSTIVSTLQKVLDDTQVKDTDRSKAILDFDRRFKGVEDMKTLVGTLSSDVGSIRANVDNVLELRSSLLDVTGAPIDVKKMRQDVQTLQLLGTNLNGADGQPIRMRDIEAQIQDIANVVGTGGAGGLDGRLAGLSASIQDLVNAKTLTLVSKTETALRGETLASETRLRSEIQTASTQTRDSLQQQFTAQITATQAGFTATLDTRLGALTEAVRTDALTNTTALINQRLASVPDQVRSQVATAINTLQGSLSGSLQLTLTAAVTAQVKDAETRLNQQITTVQAASTALTQSLPLMVSSQLAGALPGLQTTLTQSITEQVAAARLGIEAGIATTVNSTVASSLQNLDSRIATAVGQQTATIGTKVNDAVIAATRNLPDQVSSEVKAQLTAVNLDGKIQDSAKSITTQLRSEIKSAIADQDARTSSTVQGAVTLLQGQLAAAIASGVRDAKDFALSQSNTLRTELNTAIDSKIKSRTDQLVLDFNAKLQTTQDQLSTDFQNRIGGLQSRLGNLGGNPGVIIR